MIEEPFVMKCKQMNERHAISCHYIPNSIDAFVKSNERGDDAREVFEHLFLTFLFPLSEPRRFCSTGMSSMLGASVFSNSVSCARRLSRNYRD